jgi:small redox-active disulfide protein 2
MIVKILGGGCAKCNKLEKNAIEALDEMGKEYEIEHVTDFAEIAKYGVMSTPALVVDEKVLISGKVLNASKIRELLK